MDRLEPVCDERTATSAGNRLSPAVPGLYVDISGLRYFYHWKPFIRRFLRRDHQPDALLYWQRLCRSARLRLTWLDVLMWIFILVNFFATYQGRVVFGQPYYFGIMAQRSVLLSISGVLLISMMNRG